MSARRLLVLALLGLPLAACHNSDDRKVHQIGKYLDPIGKSLDDYGTVSVSAPMLVDARKVGKTNEFELNLGGDQYYKDARADSHGGLALFSQQAGESLTGIQARANLEDLYKNRLVKRNYRADQAAVERRGAFQDAAALMGVVLPAIDPSLAFKVPIAPPPADDDETNGSGDPDDPVSNTADDLIAVGDAAAEPEKLSPEEEKTARIKAMIAALSGASTDLSGATARPEIPEFTHDLPEFSKDLLPNTDLVKQVLAGENFNKFMALLPLFSGTRPAVPNRSAIITAAGDDMVEAMMRLLGKPYIEGDWKDKIVLMGTSMVSVAPGTLTRRGYVADVSMTCDLSWEPARIEVIDAFKKNHNKYYDNLLKAMEKEVLSLPATNPTKQDLIKWRSAENDLAIQKNELKKRAERIKKNKEELKALEARDQKGGAQKRQDDLKLKREDLQRLEVEKSSMESEVAKLQELARNLGDRFKRCLGDVRIATVRRDTDLASRGQPIEDTYTMVVGPHGPQLIMGVKNTAEPIVSAVSPMTEAQTLDLASSIRTQQAFALRLALLVTGFGAEAEAQHLFQHVQRLEQDAVTRTPLNSVASYSNAGGTFGYQIGPSLHGVADWITTRRVGGIGNVVKWLIAGEIHPGPDMILQRQSFPVMLFIGLNKTDLRLRVGRSKQKDGTVSFYLTEPRLAFRQTVRWIPMMKSRADRTCFKPPHGPRIRESDRVNWARNLDRAESLANELAAGGSANYSTERYVRARIKTLESQALIASSVMPLPLEILTSPLAEEEKEDCPKTPIAAWTIPRTFQLERGKGSAQSPSPRNAPLVNAGVATVGENLNKEEIASVEAVDSTGSKLPDCTFKIEEQLSNSIRLLLNYTGTELSQPLVVQLRLVLKKKNGANRKPIFAPAVLILPAPKPSPPKGPSSLSMSKQVTTSTSPAAQSPPTGSTTTTYTFPKSLPLDLAKRLLDIDSEKKAGDSASVSVSIGGNAEVGKKP